MTKHKTLIGLTVILEPKDYLKAARLGGMRTILDDSIIHHPSLPTHEADQCAEIGILSAIHDSFGRAYPMRYPDDCDPLSLSLDLSCWRDGKW